MRKYILGLMVIMASCLTLKGQDAGDHTIMKGQDTIPEQLNLDSLRVFFKLDFSDSTVVELEGQIFERKYRIDVYAVLTDTVVYKIGLKFRWDNGAYAGTWRESAISRRLYEDMKHPFKGVAEENERRKKETIEFINQESSQKAAEEVWRALMELEERDKNK